MNVKSKGATIWRYGSLGFQMIRPVEVLPALFVHIPQFKLHLVQSFLSQKFSDVRIQGLVASLTTLLFTLVEVSISGASLRDGNDPVFASCSIGIHLLACERLFPFVHAILLVLSSAMLQLDLLHVQRFEIFSV